MANRAKPKARTKAARGKIKSRGRVATLPRQSKRGRKGDNSGIHALGDDDVLYHQEQLDNARKKITAMAQEMTQLRGVYQSKRKTAKSAGFNLKAYDINVRLEGQDLGQIQVDYADAGRYLKVRGSPLAEQLNLFQNMEPPAPGTPIDPFLRGKADGEAATDAGENPYKPGSDDFVKYAAGWAEGQVVNAGKIGKTADAVH